MAKDGQGQVLTIKSDRPRKEENERWGRLTRGMCSTGTKTSPPVMVEHNPSKVCAWVENKDPKKKDMARKIWDLGQVLIFREQQKSVTTKV